MLLFVLNSQVRLHSWLEQCPEHAVKTQKDCSDVHRLPADEESEFNVAEKPQLDEAKCCVHQHTSLWLLVS